MTITLAATDAAADSSSSALTLTLNNTEGNFQVVYLAGRNATMTPTITGDGWSTVVLIEVEISDTQSRRQIALWWRTVPASQSAFTVNWSVNATKAAVAYEFNSDTSGGTWSKDNHAATDSGTNFATQLASGSAAPANSEAVTVYGLGARVAQAQLDTEDSYSDSFTAGPGASLQGSNGISGFSGYRIASGTNTTTASWTSSAKPVGLIAAFSVSAGAGSQSITPAAVTVNVTPGTLTVAPGAVDITPAAVTIEATPGSLSLALNAALDAPTVEATPGTVTVAPGAVDITPDPTTVSVTPGTVTVAAAAGEQSVTPAAVTIEATPGGLTLDLNVALDGPTVEATPGALTLDLNITPGAVTIEATPGAVTVEAAPEEGAITPAAVTVEVTPGEVTITTGAVDITPDAVTVDVTAGTLTVDLNVALTAPTIEAAPGEVTVTVGAVDITPAAVTIQAEPGEVTITGGVLAGIIGTIGPPVVFDSAGIVYGRTAGAVGGIV